MLLNILKFEVRYQLRSALFAIGFALFLLLGFAFIASDSIRIEGSGNVLMNGTYGVIIRVAFLNLLGLFVFTAFMANVVIRDDETGLAPIIRATRITKLEYLLGRFLGAYLVSLLVMLSVPLGVLLGSLMPWLDPQRIGPMMPSYYLYAIGVFTLPTVLAFGAAFFSLATATRSMMWTYVGVLASLVAWGVSGTLLDGPEHLTAGALSDPFGLTALGVVTRYWTAAERDSLLPAMTGVLLYNRLLWTGVAAIMFAIAYAVFRFDAKGRRQLPADKPEPPAVVSHAAPLMRTHRPAHANGWLQLWRVTRFDARFVLKSPAFFVLLAIGLLLMWITLRQTVEANGAEFLPVTRAVIATALTGFTLFPYIIAVYYAGELVWRDRDQRIHEIVDATAAPNWTFLVPKIIGIVLVLLTSFLVATVTAALFQLYHGYYHIEVSEYALHFVLPNLIGTVTFAAIAIFVQALVPHKFMGWVVMLLYFVARYSFNSIGLEHHLFLYNSTPSVPLSDFNGMDRFWVARAWFEVYWMLFAFILALITHLLWRRGADIRLQPRLARLGQRLHGAPGWMLGTAVALLVGVGTFIFYNTNVLNEYHTRRADERQQAEFEKGFLAFEKVPQPRIIGVKLNVDLYPQQVRARTEGVYTLENRSGAPLSAVHVRWPHRLQMQRLEVDGARLGKEYPEFQYRIYQFDTPMQPGEQRQIRFTTLLEERGFPDDDPLTRIVTNGTFLNNGAITPQLGMDREGLMRDRSKRRKYDLPPDLRPAKLEDASANAYNGLRRDSDWVMAELTVTTDADQTPIAPGYTVSDTVHGNRRTLVTRTDSPINHFFSIQSARYAVKQDTWTGANGPVNLAVYYYPGHPYNVQRMLDVMKVSLAMFSEKFSPFQFHQARILEFPGYSSFAQSFANTVPFSENIGFIQNYHEARSAETLDLVTYVTAHEIAHQWWGHQVVSADKQGAAALIETFAQYSALLVMEKLYGKEQIRKFLKDELDRYLRVRGNEVVEELPLARVETQDHIYYRKGSLVMYWLKEVVGEDVVNRSLQELLHEFAFKSAPYPSTTDFLRILRAQAGPQHEQLIEDLFEKITLYDMKANDAKAKRLANGQYQVTFEVSAAKLYADGNGKETGVPLTEEFDVGAFSAEPGKKGYTSQAALLLERRPMHSGKQTVTLLLATLPKFVGIDPYNKRIDRDSDDNLTPVSLE